MSAGLVKTYRLALVCEQDNSVLFERKNVPEDSARKLAAMAPQLDSLIKPSGGLFGLAAMLGAKRPG